jgi:nicotinic acid phosphoribosyltransferase
VRFMDACTSFWDLSAIEQAAQAIRDDKNFVSTETLELVNVPTTHSYIVVGGIDLCVDATMRLGVSEDDVEFLSRYGVSNESIEVLRSIRFTGDTWCVSNGSVVCAAEPIVEVRAPVAELLLLRARLLRHVAQQSTLVTRSVTEVGLDQSRLAFVRKSTFPVQVLRSRRDHVDVVTSQDSSLSPERMLEPFILEGERVRLAGDEDDTRRRFDRDLQWLGESMSFVAETSRKSVV